MQPYQSFTQHIDESVDSEPVAAFFDLDGTLIDSHSVKDIFAERLKNGQVTSSELIDLLNMAVLYALKVGRFEDALESSVKNLQGLSEKQFMELGEKVFTERLAPVVFPQLKAIIKRHKSLGHRLVIITSATNFQVEPIARYLGIEDILCTRLEVRKGKYTGRLDGEPCYGEAKLTGAFAYADEHDIELDESYFYSNGIEDLPLLESVGHPVAVNADKDLKKLARRKGWTSLQPDNRGSTDLLDVARTVTTFSSILPSFLIGLPFRVLGGAERAATNFSLAAWADFASLVSGLKLIIENEHHLWSHRPAVFLFNHQSAMDTVIMVKLVRRDVIGIAKKEIKRQPFLGPALSLTGTVFIDRDSDKKPRELLQPAVDKLAEGRSVAIAPEGTRSKDEKLGPFKMGAFYLAMEAGVPLVPVVIHNALDALPNHSKVVRPAEVKVTVLEPIPTESWTKRSLVKACRDVRQAYLDTLGQQE